MAKISFKAKPQDVFYADDSFAYRCVKVPTLKRPHCDMAAFRQHHKYGGLANSDLFPNILAKIRRERLGDVLRLDRLPEGVTVNNSSFLVEILIDV